jgi:hypothetical protein
MPCSLPGSLALAAALAAGPAVPGATPQFHAEFTISIRTEPRAALELFGAEGERVWAGPEWNPAFLRPVPARDQPGAVFLFSPSGESPILGYTPVFDREGGHVRHVFLRAHDSVTVIDIRLHPAGDGTTRAVVVYERTALHPGAVEGVRTLAAGDAAQAAEWERAINGYLAASGRAGR